MKMRQLLILVGAVLVLWLVFVLLDQTSVPTAEENYLVDIDTTDVTELEIMNGVEAITLTRRDDGSWFITNPSEYRANRRYMTQLLEKLDDMRIESEITDKQDRWGEFEVDTAGISLTVRQGDQEDRVVIGKAAESYKQSYARYADQTNVYLINGTYKMVLSRTMENWRDKQLFMHQQHDIVGIETDEWMLALDGDNWSLNVNGEDVLADLPGATRIQSQLARMRTSSFPEVEEYENIDFNADPDNTVNVVLQWGDIVPISFYHDTQNEQRYFVKYGNDESVYVLFEGIYNQIFVTADDLIARPPPDPITGQ